jgi:hypothetical protein
VRNSDDAPTEAGEDAARWKPSLRPLVDRLAAAVTSPLDRAFDQVFDHHVDVRSPDHGEELLQAMGVRERANANIGTWVALAATMRPVVMRVTRGAQRTRALARYSGAGRFALWGVTATLAAGRVVETSRLGVSELQVLSAYLLSRIRDRGQRPDRDAVERAALSLYTKPGRKLQLEQTRRALISASARRWVMDALRPDAEDARNRRTRARLRAVAELSDHELLRLIDAIDVIDVSYEPAAATRRSLRRGS